MKARWVRRLAGATVILVAMVVMAGCELPPMGSPGNVLGNDPTSFGTQPGFEAAINGPYTDHADGDPYSTKCAGDETSATSCDAAGTNPSYSSAGYTIAITIPAADVGTTVSVQVYDPAFNNGADTGDEFASDVTHSGFATSYQLFDTAGGTTVSTDPSQAMNRLGLCTGGTPGYQVFEPGDTAHRDVWYTLCTFIPAEAGSYALQVRTSGIPGVADAGGGSNSFSVRATSTGAIQPTVTAYGRLSVFLSSTSPAAFYLADIGAQDAGQTLLVVLFDPGDGPAPPGGGAQTIELEGPPGGVPSIPPSTGTPVACSYSAPYPEGTPVPALTPISTCAVITTNSGGAHYNDRSLALQVTIPTTYSCTTDCWWTLHESVSSKSSTYVTDRMVITTFLVAPSSS